MMKTAQPPEFAEDSRCHACYTGFTLTKRRHHCRNCGKTFCDIHSSKARSIPAYGLLVPVRVCDVCVRELDSLSDRRRGGLEAYFNKKVPIRKGTNTPPPAPTREEVAAAAVSSSVVPSSEKTTDPGLPSGPPSWCTCGMPLCICTPPADQQQGVGGATGSTAVAARSSLSNAPPAPQTTPIINNAAVTRAGFFQGSAQKVYPTVGDGIRDAIKDGSVESVRSLLRSKPELASFVDKQGQTMLHVAAIFNHMEIASLLLLAGADPKAPNYQGEVASDVALPAMAAKLSAFVNK